MFFHTYYMDGPIQNDFPYILNGWPHTECFTKHTKWMAPYRMFSNTLNGWPHTECFSIMYYMDGPIQNVNHNMLNGWPHTV